MKAFFKWTGIIIGTFFALIFLIGGFGPKMATEQGSASYEQRSAQPSASLQKFTAGDLAVAYEANTVAADQRFKGKQFEVSGRVTSIATDVFGDPYVTLVGGVNQFMEPQFSFSKSDASMVAGLKKGDLVTLRCVGKGDVAKIPMSGACSRI